MRSTIQDLSLKEGADTQRWAPPPRWRWFQRRWEPLVQDFEGNPVETSHPNCGTWWDFYGSFRSKKTVNCCFDMPNTRRGGTYELNHACECFWCVAYIADDIATRSRKGESSRWLARAWLDKGSRMAVLYLGWQFGQFVKLKVAGKRLYQHYNFCRVIAHQHILHDWYIFPIVDIPTMI